MSRPPLPEEPCGVCGQVDCACPVPVNRKRCTMCRRALAKSAFSPQKRGYGGLTSMCRRCIRARDMARRTEQQQKARMERQRVRYHVDIEAERRKQRDRLVELRVLALEHYGGSPPRCACCGEQDAGFLTLDHIDGG